MAADVAKFTAAVDKVYKTYSTQEVHLDRKEMKGLSERGTVQYIEQKYQQQLQRVRSALLQEFRNHSVVVESEVRRITAELTESLEEKYGDVIVNLKKHAEECDKLVAKHKDEIAHLKGLATAQEAYLTAMRHRWGLEQRERLRAEIQSLREELDRSRGESADLSHQLMCRDELVAQLRGELSALEGELKRQAGAFAEEKRAYDERLRGLRLEMRQQQDQFKEHLRAFEERFTEYRNKTTAELQIQDILNNRRSDALANMEEERRRHIKARTKPTPRIYPSEDGSAPEAGDYDGVGEQGLRGEVVCVPYESVKGTRYRTDDMGMDTSWRDYQLRDGPALPPGKKGQVPKFRVMRTRKGIGPNAPRATDHLPPAGGDKDRTMRPAHQSGASVLYSAR